MSASNRQASRIHPQAPFMSAHPEFQALFRTVEALLPHALIRALVEREGWWSLCPVWQEDPSELLRNGFSMCGRRRHMIDSGGAIRRDLYSCHRRSDSQPAGVNDAGTEVR